MSNLDPHRVEQLLTALKNWSNSNTGIRAIALVGSWDETERQHAEADLDVILVVDEPDEFRTGSAWMAEIDWGAAGLVQGHWSDCDFASACSRHLKFDDGPELEVSFVPPQWASIDPVDPGTRRIAGNGMRVVHDPDGWLGKLLAVL